MPAVLIEILLVLALILFNGLLAMAEIAIVSARKARLEQSAREGDARSRAALDLANAPTEFLASVQIGITLAGILAGAFSGATISQQLSAWFAQVPWLAESSEALALGLVVLVITFLSLIFGELLPKSLGLRDPEAAARSVAIPMQWLARLARPLVRLLSGTADALLPLFGGVGPTKLPVTEEELKVLVEQGTQAGVFEQAESDMIERILRLGDRRVSGLMTPRTEILWLDLDDPAEVIRTHILGCAHSRLPVAHGDLDHVEGVVQARDLLALGLQEQPLALDAAALSAAMQQPLFMPESMPAFRALEIFQASRQHLALVLDEFGGVQGLVTITDILEAIVGELPALEELAQPEAIMRSDGSWLVDGRMQLDEFKDLLELQQLPGTQRLYYDTLGGLVMDFLGRIPHSGDVVERGSLKFEVVDMDGFRVDKVLVSRIHHKP